MDSIDTQNVELPAGARSLDQVVGCCELRRRCAAEIREARLAREINRLVPSAKLAHGYMLGMAGGLARFGKQHLRKAAPTASNVAGKVRRE